MSAYSAHDREMLGAFLRTQEERWTTRTERERVGGWARGRNLSERATGNNMSGDERQGLFVLVIGNSISSQRESAAEIHYQNLVQGVFILHVALQVLYIGCPSPKPVLDVASVLKHETYFSLHGREGSGHLRWLRPASKRAEDSHKICRHPRFDGKTDPKRGERSAMEKGDNGTLREGCDALGEN